MSLSVRFRHRFTNLQLDVEFESPTPGVTALFGPSGCGKSSVIMAVAGLLQPDSCRIALDGTVLADTEARIAVPTEHRRIGLVFQDARLFPHMSVLRNLRYGMRRAQAGPIHLDDVVDLLGIGHLLGRRPNSLSGGERQRVAIGRALLAQPLLLAMDEPLASLDGPRKAEILPFLAGLKTALKLPILYVTHSPEELASLADTLVLIDLGHVLAKGPLEEIITRGDLPLAIRDDAGAVLSAEVVEHDQMHRLTALMSAGVRLWVPLLERDVGATLRVRIPAREVILAAHEPGPTSIHNVIPGRVRAVTQVATGHAALVEVSLGGATLLARVTSDAVERLCLAPGLSLFALVKSMSIEVLAG
jgi:molybdate transport system ATP-binding protein